LWGGGGGRCFKQKGKNWRHSLEMSSEKGTHNYCGKKRLRDGMGGDVVTFKPVPFSRKRESRQGQPEGVSPSYMGGKLSGLGVKRRKKKQFVLQSKPKQEKERRFRESSILTGRKRSRLEKGRGFSKKTRRRSQKRMEEKRND